MKALFIGGTGTISTDISKLLLEKGWELTLLNRGTRNSELPGAKHIQADINDEAAVAEKLAGQHFDVVADFIAFMPSQVERDIRLFAGQTTQYIFISSASAYQKPLSHPVITESTPLSNPYWQYSRNKIACEDVLMAAYREGGFPVTIVRPSHTFSDRALPLPLHGDKGSWQILKRMLEGKPVLVHDGGASLWTVTASKDFAPGFVGLMGNLHAIGEAVNITSDESLTWNQIMGIIARELSVEYKPCYVPAALLAKSTRYDFRGALLGDKANTVIFDNSKLKRLVPGFTCTTRFDQAAAASVQYFLTHPEAQVEDPEFDAFCDRMVVAMDAVAQVISQ